MVKENTHEVQNRAPRKTVFVRNLPFTTTNKELEELFSDDAPVKQAFVVKDKDNRSKCRGFGYVQFVVQEDADKAVNTPKTISNRKLKICYADKKPKHEKRKKEKENAEKLEDASEETDNKKIKTEAESEIAENEEKKEDVPVQETKQEKKKKKKKENKNTKNKDSKDEELPNDTKTIKNKLGGGDEKIEAGSQDQVPAEKQSEKKPKVEAAPKTDLQRTIVLTGLTSKVKRKAFRVLCEKFGEVENILYPVPERSEVTAFVRFKDYKSTIRAVQKIVGQKVKKSNSLAAVLLTKEGKFPKRKTLDKSRLIVRNLSFKVEADELIEHFAKFGKVLDVSIPTKKVNGKEVKIGCAFVQFDNPAHGLSALQGVNMKEIKGRTVIVDWALKKDQYQNEKEKGATDKVKESSVNKSAAKKQNNAKEEIKDEDVEEDGSDAEEEIEEDADDSENDEEIEEEERVEEEVESGAEEQASDIEGDRDVASDGDGEESEDELEDMEQDDDEEDEDDEEHEKKQAWVKEKMKDAKEGKTIFVRNMSYNTDDEGLMEEFEKFGEIEYCKIVMDPETGHSKGCAFLKFKTKESAEKCIQETEKLQDRQKNMVIDGRPIVVSKAVTKGKMGELERQRATEKQETDKRNLYLAYEGVITKKTPGAEDLPEAYMKLREKTLADKKIKLKNPQYFISRVRLCFRNLPLNMNADELKDKLTEFSQIEGLSITDTKIMRSKDRKDQSGSYRSMGFGFVDFEKHEDALMLLRATNNNPEIFGENRRPIVEFSVENTKALKILDLKKQKIEQMKAEKKQGETEGMTEEQKEGFDTGKHRSYKEKANEKRLKRRLRYQRKRQEKRAAKAENSEDETEKPSVDKSPAKKQPAKPAKKQKPNKVPKADAATPTAETKNEKPDTVPRKRPVNNNEPTVTNLESGENPNKRSRKSTTLSKEKEENKFNNLVEKYKNKLNSNTTSKKKVEGGDRWFEEL